MKTFIVTTAEDAKGATSFNAPPVYLFYRLSHDGGLMRASLPMTAKGGVMGVYHNPDLDWGKVDSERLAREIIGECGRRGYAGVLLDFEECMESAVCAQKVGTELKARGIVYFVPLRICASCPSAKIIIPSAINGGSYDEMLQAYAAKFGADRLCLEVVRVSRDYIMPVEGGDGQRISMGRLEEIKNKSGAQEYFSKELCAKYFTYLQDGQVHFVLYDDVGTAAAKIERASEAGYIGAFLLYSEWGKSAGEIMA
ncbi:MAG: hypothetical protein RR829_04805 [Oscillospiraceae bacterium]